MRRSHRSTKRNPIVQVDLLPYPDGDPVEPIHHRIEEWCSHTTDHLIMGTIDNLVVHVLFATKRRRWRDRSLIPPKCPESFEIVDLVPRRWERSFGKLNSSSREHSPDEWLALFHKTIAQLSETSYPSALSPFLSNSFMERAVLRYLLLRTSTRVRVGSVKFSNDLAHQCCIRTTQPIQAHEYIWELNGLLSNDCPTSPTVSSITPHSSQKVGKGPRLMTGPARFLNHSCSPNAVLMPLACKPAYVVQSLVAIPAENEITVDYGKGYWESDSCQCSHCSSSPPTYTSPILAVPHS